MSGWVKLHRSILDSKYGKNPELLTIFITLLLKANHKTGFTSDGTQINAGQLMTSHSKLSVHFGMSRETLRRRLKRLESDGQIEQQTSNKNTVISIVKWHEYQSDEHQVEHQLSSEWASTEHQLSTNKNNNNNNNNKNNKNNILSVIEPDLVPDEFVNERALLDYWNRKGIIKHADSANNLKRIKRRLKNTKFDTLAILHQAIDNYSMVLNDSNTFWSHRWSLWEFLSRENAQKFHPQEFISTNFFNSNSAQAKQDRMVNMENPYDE